jgi:hypothetical protein
LIKSSQKRETRGGSALSAPDGSCAWNLTLRDIGGVLVNAESLALERPLEPTGLVDTLTVLAPLLVIPGYGALDPSPPEPLRNCR